MLKLRMLSGNCSLVLHCYHLCVCYFNVLFCFLPKCWSRPIECVTLICKCCKFGSCAGCQTGTDKSKWNSAPIRSWNSHLDSYRGCDVYALEARLKPETPTRATKSTTQSKKLKESRENRSKREELYCSWPKSRKCVIFCAEKWELFPCVLFSGHKSPSIGVSYFLGLNLPSVCLFWEQFGVRQPAGGLTQWWWWWQKRK